MITEFDKSDIAPHYKKRFSECILDDDYEGALDYLLKYRDERNNDDFHLACGMLYLQMCLDSEDAELAVLAYRESAMHLLTHPDCESAYRNVLAALLLRRDGEAFVEWCKFIKSRPLDFRKIIGELAESGVLFITSESEPFDFDSVFDGEYGEIQSADMTKSEGDDRKASLKEQKIIAFEKTPRGKNAERVKSVSADGRQFFSRGAEPRRHGGNTFAFDGGEIDSEDDGFEDFINEYLYGEDYDEEDEATVLGAAELLTPFDEEADKKPINDDIHRAEAAFEKGDTQTALDILSDISRSDEGYYFSLILRAHILMVAEKYDESERLLDEAMQIAPHSAIGGSIRCRLYELQDKTELIPQALKNIDVRDYINCAHVYKSFEMAMKYCDDNTLEELLREYIDEFNIIDMRIVYAQLMYNRGEREYALDELYIISRVLYSDINSYLIYSTAKSGADKLALSPRLPDGLLCAILEQLLAVLLSVDMDATLTENDELTKSVDFFLSMDFVTENPLIKPMFAAVRAIAESETTERRMREELVAPYVEPIVKGVILGELLGRAPKKPFLVDYAFCPISSDDVDKLRDGLSKGCYAAYALVLMLCDKKLGNLIELAETTDFGCVPDASERAKALYLVKKACGRALDDERLYLAVGYTAQSDAMREYKELNRALNKKR